MMSCSKEEERRLLFAFLAQLLQFAPSELTMFAGGQKDGNVIVILNLFISSGTRWSEEATLYLFASPQQMGAGEGWFGALSRATFWGGNTSRANSEQDLTRIERCKIVMCLSISNREDGTDEQREDRVAGENMQIVCI